MENILDSLEATDILGADPAIGSTGGKLVSQEMVRLDWVRSVEQRCN